MYFHSSFWEWFIGCGNHKCYRSFSVFLSGDFFLRYLCNSQQSLKKTGLYIKTEKKYVRIFRPSFLFFHFLSPWNPSIAANFLRTIKLLYRYLNHDIHDDPFKKNIAILNNVDGSRDFKNFRLLYMHAQKMRKFYWLTLEFWACYQHWISLKAGCFSYLVRILAEIKVLMRFYMCHSFNLKLFKMVTVSYLFGCVYLEAKINLSLFKLSIWKKMSV